MVGSVSFQDIMDAAKERRERIYEYMIQDPPMTVRRIREVEGINDRTARNIIHEIEAEKGIEYKGIGTRDPRDTMPFGLTPSTLRLRQKLGDLVYLLTERGRESDRLGRHRVGPKIGLNSREQIRAEQRPFNHDWTLSQIERLARELNRDPVEMMLSCLTS